MKYRLSLNPSLSLLVFFFSFFVYFRLIPLDIETQPVFIFILSFLSLVMNIDKLRYVKNDELMSLTLIFILFFYAFMSFSEFGMYGLIETIKLMIGPFCYFFYRRFRLDYNNSYQYIITILIFYLVISTLFGPNFINSIDFFGIRSTDRFTFFMSEPSYFSPVLSVLLYLTALNIFGKKRFILLSLFFVITFFLGSVYNYLIFCFLLFSFTLLNVNKYKFLISIISFVLLFLLFFYSVVNGYLNDFLSGRIVNFINSIYLAVVGDIDFFDFIYVYEPSGSTRLILNYLAFSVPFTQDFFGILPGGFQLRWLDIASAANIDISSHPVLMSSVAPSSQTYFSNLVSSIGVFSIFYIAMLLMSNKKKERMTKNQKACQLFLYLTIFFFTFFQIQITNPLLWMLIAFAKEDVYEK